VLFDDRPKESPGVKFGDAELIGVPWILIAGKTAADGIVELWNRRTNEREQVSLDDAVATLVARRAVG
jgi:prolyl-tRNA synthetase